MPITRQIASAQTATIRLFPTAASSCGLVKALTYHCNVQSPKGNRMTLLSLKLKIISVAMGT